MGRLTILMYHRVLPDALWMGSPLPGLVMPMSCFEAQIKGIAARYEVTTVSKALNRLRVGARDEKPLLAITFDDGYDDNHTHAAPILEQFGIRGTFYIVSGFVGTDTELWFDRAARWFHGSQTYAVDALASSIGVPTPWAMGHRPIVRQFMAYLKSLPREARDRAIDHVTRHPGVLPRRDADLAMSIADAQDLSRRGHEIGAHTVTHPLLTQEDDDSLRSEVHGSRHTISDWIGTPVPGFCYPNGDTDDRVTQAVRDAGYSHAPTVAPGYNDKKTDPFRLRRLDMNSSRILSDGAHDEAMFRAELTMLHPA
jgi:peptidoglycan/xylan/chitin deacetylase (PgdA/CDA1 family)